MPIRSARSVWATASGPANEPTSTKAKAENPATYAFIRAPIANCTRSRSPIFAVASADPKTPSVATSTGKDHASRGHPATRPQTSLQIAPDETLPFSGSCSTSCLTGAASKVCAEACSLAFYRRRPRRKGFNENCYSLSGSTIHLPFPASCGVAFFYEKATRRLRAWV